MRQQFIHLMFIVTAAMPSMVMAEEVSQLNSDVSSINTSDGISQKQLDIFYRNPRRELFYPFENEAEQGWDWGIRSVLSDGRNSQYAYRGTGLQLLGGRKFSKLASIESQLGFHQLKNTSTDESKTIFSGGVKGSAILDEKYTTSLEISHGFVDGALIQTGGISNQFTALSIKPGISARWSNRWLTQLRSQFHNISDDNQKSQIDIATLYGISTGVPWIWVGLGAEKLTYSKRSTSYWSPSEFISYGPRLEATVPVYEKVSAAGGLNINRLYDKDTGTWGNGHYFSGRIQYGSRNEFNLSIYLIKIESVQNNNKWESTQSGLNASVPF